MKHTYFGEKIKVNIVRLIFICCRRQKKKKKKRRRFCINDFGFSGLQFIYHGLVSGFYFSWTILKLHCSLNFYYLNSLTVLKGLRFFFFRIFRYSDHRLLELLFWYSVLVLVYFGS